MIPTPVLVDGEKLPLRARPLHLGKIAKSNRPSIVRSLEEQERHMRLVALAVPRLVERRKNLPSGNSLRSANITLALRKLLTPMYTVRLLEGDYTVCVSGAVLSDYAVERISFVVVAKPEKVSLPQQRTFGINTTAIEKEYVDSFHDARSNAHAMGKAQNAWRYAHLEGDKPSERAAHFWLFHGSLDECKNPRCHETPGSPCNPNRRKLQTAELQALAMRHAQVEGERSYFSGSRMRHKMPNPTIEELARLFDGNYRVAESRKA